MTAAYGRRSSNAHSSVGLVETLTLAADVVTKAKSGTSESATPAGLLPGIKGRLGLAVARVRTWRWAPWATGTAAVGALAWPILEYRPYETTYYNVFVGGLGGAQRNGLFRMPMACYRASGVEGDYWYNSLRAGVRAAHQLDPRSPMGFCGGTKALYPEPWPHHEHKREKPPIVFTDTENPAAILYACPLAGGWCTWKVLRDLETKRPVLKREERGGGLVWEVLGPETGTRHAPVTPENVCSLDPRQP